MGFRSSLDPGSLSRGGGEGMVAPSLLALPCRLSGGCKQVDALDFFLLRQRPRPRAGKRPPRPSSQGSPPYARPRAPPPGLRTAKGAAVPGRRESRIFSSILRPSKEKPSCWKPEGALYTWKYGKSRFCPLLARKRVRFDSTPPIAPPPPPLLGGPCGRTGGAIRPGPAAGLQSGTKQVSINEQGDSHRSGLPGAPPRRPGSPHPPPRRWETGCGARAGSKPVGPETRRWTRLALRNRGWDCARGGLCSFIQPSGGGGGSVSLCDDVSGFCPDPPTPHPGSRRAGQLRTGRTGCECPEGLGRQALQGSAEGN